ncbi:MAG: hypothetical protein L0154_13595 [Chloroflexi bacterium]|nr:hypothetical protein [Chloroflexota bacterium]
MAYEISWLIEKRLILITFIGVLSKEDLYAVSEAAFKMAESGTAPVHSITDGTSLTSIEIGIDDLRKIMENRSYKSGWSVTVTPGRMERFLASIANQLFRMKSRHFATYEEAITFLQAVDTTLPEISPRS